MLISGIIAFILGTIYGSFLNALLWRTPKKQTMTGRSKCRNCDHTLAWYDLIPIVSFILLRGKCRYCHKKISIQYPLVEFITGAIFLLYNLYIPAQSLLPSIMSFLSLLLLIGLLFFDLFYFILPDFFIIPGIIAFGIYDFLILKNPQSFFISTLLLGSFFAILYLATKGRGLGFGDVKLAVLIGLILGTPTSFFAVLSGIWLGGIVAALLLMSRKTTLKGLLPLGSFLSLATILFIIFQNEVIFLQKLF
jgi:leader peptidase (prepilin peptidase)/N-methyltransferase